MTQSKFCIQSTCFLLRLLKVPDPCALFATPTTTPSCTKPFSKHCFLGVLGKKDDHNIGHIHGLLTIFAALEMFFVHLSLAVQGKNTIHEAKLNSCIAISSI